MSGCSSICNFSSPPTTLGPSTHPGRQYSTTNLKTPCRSGAWNCALYVVACSVEAAGSLTRAVRTCGSSMVKSNWRSDASKAVHDDVPLAVVVCCESVKVNVWRKSESA